MAKYTWIEWFKPTTNTWYYGIPEKQIEFVELKSHDGVSSRAEISVKEFDSNDVIWYQKLEKAEGQYGNQYNWGDATVIMKKLNMDDQLFFEVRRIFQEPYKIITKHLTMDDIIILSNHFSFDEIQQMIPMDLQSARVKGMISSAAKVDEDMDKKRELVNTILRIKDSSNIVQLIPYLEQLRSGFESDRGFASSGESPQSKDASVHLHQGAKLMDVLIYICKGVYEDWKDHFQMALGQSGRISTAAPESSYMITLICEAYAADDEKTRDAKFNSAFNTMKNLEPKATSGNLRMLDILCFHIGLMAIIKFTEKYGSRYQEKRYALSDMSRKLPSYSDGQPSNPSERTHYRPPPSGQNYSETTTSFQNAIQKQISISKPKAIATGVGCGIIPFFMNLASVLTTEVTFVGEFSIFHAMSLAWTGLFSLIIMLKRDPRKRTILITMLVTSFGPLIGFLFYRP